MPEWWNSVDGVARFNNWMQVLIVVFGLLTAVVTALTIFASNRISRLQAEDTAGLQTRLEAAEQVAATTRETLKVTSEKLTTAEQAIQSATSEAARAQKSADESKAKLQPRTLTPAQRRAFVEALRGGPSGRIDVVAVLGDSESITFAAELDGALKDAGWPTAGVSQAVYTPRGPVGLLLKVHSKEFVPTHASTLQKALASAGFEAPAVLDGSVERGYLGIVVGHKP